MYLNGHYLHFPMFGLYTPYVLIWYFCHYFMIFIINKYKSLNTIEINNWNKIEGIFYILPRYNDWSENNILPGICEFWYLWLNQNTLHTLQQWRSQRSINRSSTITLFSYVAWFTYVAFFYLPEVGLFRYMQSYFFLE